MASTSESAHCASLASPILPFSDRSPPASSRRGSHTPSAVGASGDAGHVDASYRETGGEKGEFLRGGRGKFHQQAGIVSENVNLKRCRHEVGGNGTKFNGGECQEMHKGVPPWKGAMDSDRSERRVSRHSVKRFKKGVQQHVCNNEKMHPRSRHKGIFVNYLDFAEKYPFLKPYLRSAKFGQCNLNFRDPLALYFLSKAILQEFYNLEFELPVDEEHRYLIPCVPSRANYLHHIADLLVDVDVEAAAYLKGDIPGIATIPQDRNPRVSVRSNVADPSEFADSSNSAPSSDGRGSSGSAISNCGTSCGGGLPSLSISCTGDEAASPLRGDRVKVLDVGVGANCIYPLLGSREYGWRFVGCDVSEASLAVAQHNVQMNALEKKISLRLQPRRDNYFVNIVQPGEFYCLTMCNPPFHSSREQVNVCPVRSLEAQDHEIICDGGESQFIASLIEESKTVCAQVLWFTTLVARAATVKEMKKRLWEELRCFSHERQQQEKLMGTLWMGLAHADKIINTRCSEEPPAEDVPQISRKDVVCAKASRAAATSPAWEDSRRLEKDKKEKEIEGSAPGVECSVGQEPSKVPKDASNKGRVDCGEQDKRAMKGALAGSSSSTCGKPELKEAESGPAKCCVHVCEFRVKELLQGKQTRWVICWTYWTSEQRKMVRRSIEEARV